MQQHFTLVDLIKHYHSTSHDVMLWLLLLVVGLDILTGWSKATFLKELSSSISLRGLGKHFTVITFGIFIYPILTFVGFEEVAIAMLGVVIITYLISLAENMAILGFPMPTWVIDRLQKVKQVLEEQPRDNKITK